MRHKASWNGARMLALVALAAAAASCAAHPGPVRLAVQRQVPATATVGPAPTPAGWRHVADAEFDPSNPRDSRVGYSWTAKSDVRWVLSCETVKGTRPESIYIYITSADAGPGSVVTTANSARMVRCPVGRVVTAGGTIPLAELSRHNPHHDVIMQLVEVESMSELTDGSVIYRADAFEKKSH